MERSYEEMAIDKNNLDEECLTIPALFDYYATKEVEAANNRDILKDQTDICKADIDDTKARVELVIRGMEVSQINIVYGLNLANPTSLTVGAINSIVLGHPDVIKAKQAHRDKCDELRQKVSDTAVFRVGRKSVEKKMIMLDNLARLHGQGYFSKIEGKKFKGQTLEALKKRVAETIRQDRAQRMADKVKKPIVPNIPVAPKAPRRVARQK